MHIHVFYVINKTNNVLHIIQCLFITKYLRHLQVHAYLGK